MSITAPLVADPTPTVSHDPVVLPAPGRALPLELRVTAPASGEDLPVVLLSHGQGPSNHLSSSRGYAPLAHFWAARGFVVLQPTHLSSAALRGLVDPDHPEAPLHWRSRATDMSRILDGLALVEAAVPTLEGRIAHDRVAVAGHSMGGHTASLLLGARMTDPRDGSAVDLADPRITAGVLLAAPGRGAALLPAMAQQYPALASIDFGAMTTPALVVVGAEDASPMFTAAGPPWHADPFHRGAGPGVLVTLAGGGHGLGGISGYDVAETDDESPERVAAVQQLTWAWLTSALTPGDRTWGAVSAAFAARPDAWGRIEERRGS